MGAEPSPSLNTGLLYKRKDWAEGDKEMLKDWMKVILVCCRIARIGLKAMRKIGVALVLLGNCSSLRIARLGCCQNGNGGCKRRSCGGTGVEANYVIQREALDTDEDVGDWLDEINLGGYKDAFAMNKVTGEYLDSLSNFTTEEILRFIRRCHMKWGDFITLCKELRRVKVACLRGEQEVRRPWWAPACLSVVYAKAARQNRQSRVVSLKFDP